MSRSRWTSGSIGPWHSWVQLTDDTTAPLDAIPATCTATGETITIDVYL